MSLTLIVSVLSRYCSSHYSPQTKLLRRRKYLIYLAPGNDTSGSCSRVLRLVLGSAGVLWSQDNTCSKGTGPSKDVKNKLDMSELFSSGVWYLSGITYGLVIEVMRYMLRTSAV